jgi:hypothetical protein
MSPTAAWDAYLDGFTEDPGYLDYGRIGPLARVAAAEVLGQTEVLSRARFGSLDHFAEQDARMRAAVAAVTGFRADQIVAQPNTSTGLMHAMFGLTGDVLLSRPTSPACRSPRCARRKPCTSLYRSGWTSAAVRTPPGRSRRAPCATS